MEYVGTKTSNGMDELIVQLLEERKYLYNLAFNVREFVTSECLENADSYEKVKDALTRWEKFCTSGK